MLSLFRQGGLVQFLMAGVVALIIAAFAVGYRAEDARDIECALKVYDTCITPKEYNAALRLSLVQQMSDEETRAQKVGERTQLALVERELLLREARRLDLTISEEELDAELLKGFARYSLPVEESLKLGGWPYPGSHQRPLNVMNRQTGAFEFAIYKRVLANIARMNTKEFKEEQRREMVAARVRDYVMSQARVTENEAFLRYESFRSEATATVIRLTTDWFARFGVDASDATVTAYIDAHKEDVNEQWEKAKATWKAGCPLVSEVATEILTSEDKADKQQKIESAKKALDGGEEFAAVAARFNSGDAALTGGYLGCLTEAYGKGGPELLTALKDLKEGKTSKVIETPKGFHILKFHGTLAEGKEEAIAKLALARVPAVRAAAEAKATAFAERLIKSAAGAPDLKALIASMAKEAVVLPGASDAKREALVEFALAQESAPLVEDSAPFNREGSPIRDAAGGEINAGTAVFGLKNPGEFFDKPVKTRSGLAVLGLKEKTLVTPEDFAKDEQRAEFLEQLKVMKGGEVLKHYVARLRTAAEPKIKLNPKYGSQAAEATEEEQGG